MRLKKEFLTDVMKGRVRIALLFVMMAALSVLSVPAGNGIVSAVMRAGSANTIIIDPGHGGFDGGAESKDGVCEKDINLAIGLELKELLEDEGYRVVMTRDEDKALGKTESTAIRSMKTADLIARKELIDKVDPLLTVSIHLNSFKEDERVRGAQVFYPAGDENDEVIIGSRLLAEKIRTELIKGLDDGTERAVLTKNDIRILKNVRTPIVLVECGFLSNYEEAKLLEMADYQRKIAVSIKNGIIQYTHFK